MANLTEKDNLSFVQNIRKRLYIIFLNRRAISTFHKQPEWLKNDVDVIDKILAICENVSDKETILMSSPSVASEMDKESLNQLFQQESLCRCAKLHPFGFQLQLLHILVHFHKNILSWKVLLEPPALHQK